jgi:hypothetical protein
MKPLCEHPPSFAFVSSYVKGFHVFVSSTLCVFVPWRASHMPFHVYVFFVSFLSFCKQHPFVCLSVFVPLCHVYVLFLDKPVFGQELGGDYRILFLFQAVEYIAG